VDDGDRDAQRGAQVVHPAGSVAGLDHDVRSGGVGSDVPREQIVNVGRRCRDRLEAVLSAHHVHHAENALELAEIDRDDLLGTHAILLW